MNSGQFKKGQSGNPKGRKPNEVGIGGQYVRKNLELYADFLTEELVKKIREGDTAALKMALDRVYPVPRLPHIRIHLPDLKTPDDVLDILRILMKKLASGEINGEMIAPFLMVLDAKMKAIESAKVIPEIEEIKKNYEELKKDVQA